MSERSVIDRFLALLLAIMLINMIQARISRNAKIREMSLKNSKE